MKKGVCEKNDTSKNESKIKIIINFVKILKRNHLATKKAVEENPLLKTIITSLSDRKAQELVTIDLRQNEDAIVDYLIVCHGDSTTQVDAMAGNLEKDVKDMLRTKPYRTEGKRNSLWVIVDYVDIIVHIFYKEARDFYKLEDLWSDGHKQVFS
jgi:ribosome-associated protein